MKLSLSPKQIKINEANSTMFTVVAVATIISVFCLVSTKTLFSQLTHQRRVIAARSAANKQLNTNIDAANNLKTQFDVFNSSNPNIIGGIADNNSTGPKDGDNARITLDALPSQYDFPALVTSLEKILDNRNIASPTVEGTDQLDQVDNNSTAQPKPFLIALKVGGISNYSNIQDLIKDLEKSIRPFDITSLELTGSQTKMQVTFNINTYYQQARSLDNGTKEVK